MILKLLGDHLHGIKSFSVVQYLLMMIFKNLIGLKRCSLNQDIIPEPTALLVNKTKPDQLAKTNLSHYGLVNQMQEVFQKWSPAIFIGYNSLSFDEEF